MAIRRNKDIKEAKTRRDKRVDISQAVNRTITLPSALKPAKPPEGSKWENRHDPSFKIRQTE